MHVAPPPNRILILIINNRAAASMVGLSRMATHPISDSSFVFSELPSLID